MDQETVDRMDGLVIMQKMISIMHHSEYICADFLKEGFEVKDVIEYITHKLDLVFTEVVDDIRNGGDGHVSEK